MQGSVTQTIDAPISEVWDLVSDVTRIGEFSNETFEAEWLEGATGPAVGAKFRGHVKRNGRGPTYWSPCEVTVCERESKFEFAVGPSADRAINNWGYELKDVDGGTEVTEYFRLAERAPVRAYWAIAGRRRLAFNERGMAETLAAMKRVLEEPQPSPD